MSFLSDLFTTTNKTTSTSNSTRTTPAALQPLEDTTAGSLMSTIQDPTADLQPIENAARNQVNEDYAAVPQTLRDRLLSSGSGQSGKFGLATAQSELSRIQALSGLQGQFANLALTQKNNAQSLAQRLLAAQSGTSTTASGTSSSTGITQGLGGFATLSALTALHSYLGGGSTGGGGGGGGGGFDNSYGDYSGTAAGVGG